LLCLVLSDHVNYTNPGLSREHLEPFAWPQIWNVREKDLGSCNWHDPFFPAQFCHSLWSLGFKNQLLDTWTLHKCVEWCIL